MTRTVDKGYMSAEPSVTSSEVKQPGFASDLTRVILELHPGLSQGGLSSLLELYDL
jgi:hypothetical protein